jgi:hypothetical protein
MEVLMSKRNLFLAVGALALVAAVTATYVNQGDSADVATETIVNTAISPDVATPQNTVSEKVTTPAVVNTEANSVSNAQTTEATDTILDVSTVSE